MRKTRVLAVMVASLVSVASFAQAQSPTPAPQAGRHGMRAGPRGHRDGGLFRGIKLSDAERAKVKEVHGKYAPENKKLFDSMKPAMQEARALRQKGDTAGARAVMERNKSGRDQFKALREREQADIRAALTPENQKLFDQNVQQQATRRAERGKKGGRRGHGQAHTNG
jgi:Spy/CpxP family protein refolding chaperone